ncbi:MAG TPA: hypothetical protein DCG69_10395 [Bacteroidales bacterium]|nr:hypothetical protein [Bacteroidales bacterium]
MAQPGTKGGGEYKYYPRMHKRTKMNLREVSEIISRRCTLHSADILATLTAFAEVIPELLLHNNSVELGDLGTFSLHVKGAGAIKMEDVNKTHIKEVKMAFLPSTFVKKKLSLAKFTK